MAASGKRRHHLSLQEKVDVIKKSARGTSVQAISEELRCGKTQIYGILKDKESIIALYESNASSSLHHSRKRTRLSEYSEVNEALYEWYLLACSKNIYPDGPQLTEKAKEIAERLGKRNEWMVRKMEEATPYQESYYLWRIW